MHKSASADNESCLCARVLDANSRTHHGKRDIFKQVCKKDLLSREEVDVKLFIPLYIHLRECVG
jgi:hypothetical protein